MSDPDESKVPLVVDLDDTLLRTDLLYECFWKGMGSDPLGTLQIVWKNWGDRARLKVDLATLAQSEPTTQPVDEEILAVCHAAAAEGREVVLATASTKVLVEPIAEHIGGFDAVLTSDENTNLSGEEKAAALVERYGESGFDYVGDSLKDIPVWQKARKCLVARPSEALPGKLEEAGLAPEVIGSRWRWIDLWRGLRPRQWIKNILMVLPLIAAHTADVWSILAVVLGFVSYSAAASAIYLVNDLTDIDADRAHPTKCKRIFAAGRVPIRVGMAASVALGLFALTIAALLGWAMFIVIGFYIVLTLAYSMRLKRARWVDIATLAGLYTLRVVAGAVATGVPASGWLIGFIFPLFLTLACVKRLTELAKATTDGPVPGRKYSKSDRGDLLNVAILAGIASCAVFVGYSYSSVAQVLYYSAWQLRLAVLPLALWLTRMIWTGWMGSQAYDPIEFALRDKFGLALIAIAMITLVWAV
ncbi:UbiA family prenyltransferase [Halovulum sp. GXIMD14793]